jgi:AP endonuclease-1
LIRDVTPETDSVPQEERTPIAAKKTSKEKREAESNGKTNLDEALVVTPVEKTNRTKVKVDVVESSAIEIKHKPATPSKRNIKSRKNLYNTTNSEDITQVSEEAVSNKTKSGKETEGPSTVLLQQVPETSPKRKIKGKAEAAETVDLEVDQQVDDQTPQKARRKRQTKEEKEAEAMPLAARTTGLRMFVGAHVSIASGVEKAVTNSVHIGCALLRPSSLNVHR